VLIGGGIGLAAVALVGGYFFLGGGGSDSSATPAAPHTSATSLAPTPTGTVIAVGKPTAAVKTFKGDVGRDPFQALVTSPPAPTTTAAKPASTTLPAAATSTSGAVVGPTTLPTSGPTLPITPTSAAPTTSAAPKIMVVLKAIAFHGATPYVVVSYSGQQYALKTGETAGESLKVLAIAPDDGTATFQLGDQTFDLHIGQSYVD
jgi:hypothetical protein